MSSISGNDAYNARIRAQIREYQEIEASRNSPVMILDSQTRRGHITPGTNAYSAGPIEGGKSKLAKTLKTIGQFVKPLGRNLKPVKRALMERAVYEIGKPMYAPEPMQAGRSHNQKKKGVFKFLRNVGEFVKPVAQPLFQAATKRGVQAIEDYGGAYERKHRTDMSPGVSSWISEINEMRSQMQDRENSRNSGVEVSYKDAMMAASAERHRQNGTKPKPKRTAEQIAATKAKRAAKKAAALFAELPTGSGRRRY